MIVVRDVLMLANIDNQEILRLTKDRLERLSFNEVQGFYVLVVVEADDTIEDITLAIGLNILENRFTGIRYDQPGFVPSFEFIEEFPACFDMAFVLDDSGAGIEVFVSKEEGVNVDLIAMCRRFALKTQDEKTR